MADTSKINEILNYYGLKTNIEETKKWVKQYVGDALTGITTDLMTNVTYNELVSLRDNNNLKPGMLYRMTDYVTKVYSEDESVSSAWHQFDLILFANTTNILNENAFAILHNGDEYFSNSKLSVWEIKYSIDNDDKRFDYLTIANNYNYEGFEYIDTQETPIFFYHISGFTIDGNYIYVEVADINDADEFEEWLDNPNKDNIDYRTPFIIPEYSLVKDEEINIPFGNVEISTDGIKYTNGLISGYYSDKPKTRFYDNNTGYELSIINLTNDYFISENNLYVLSDDYEHSSLFYFKSEDLTENTVLYSGNLDHESRFNKYYNLVPSSVRMINGNINIITYTHNAKSLNVTPIELFKPSAIKTVGDAKGIIYYLKDEFNNEAPYDFKNILQNDGEYTFGKNGEDYSLNGYVNGIYNNKILPCVNSETGKQTINKIRVTGEDCNTNIFKPTCVNSYIDFPISECDISMNDDGELVVFKTQDFVSGIENDEIPQNMRKEYLTFEAVNDNTEIIFKTYTDDPQYTKTIEVSKDKVNWESKTSSSEGVILASLNAGEKLYLRGNNSSYAYYNENEGEYLPNFILPLNYCYVYGNIMSLIDSNNFRTLTEITDNYALYSLFYDRWKGMYSGEYILSHLDKRLVLPATTLTEGCYYHMFRDCTSLTTAPSILPATTLAERCYESMFVGCTNLTAAPELPATTLANYCYYKMFYGCTSLTTAPTLPATELANDCYNWMFMGCNRLTTAPELPATTLADRCYRSMFENCSSLTTAPELSATKLVHSCYRYMFQGCSNLTTAPELPATTLAISCYNCMFSGCTSLTTAPELSATTLADGCYRSMFSNCSSLTTAPVLPATTLANNCYRSMFEGCSNLNYIKCLASDISASNCTTNWVNGVASTGTFVKHPDATSWTTGVNGIPTNWAVEEDDDIGIGGLFD